MDRDYTRMQEYLLELQYHEDSVVEPWYALAHSSTLEFDQQYQDILRDYYDSTQLDN